MEPSSIAGIWVGAFLTLAIYSFLYKDNPVYRLAESIFVGISLGYEIGLVFYRTIWPARLSDDDDDEFSNELRRLAKERRIW